jgi:hypothetical protein
MARTRRIELKVSDEEYETIARNAAAVHRSISDFLRLRGLPGTAEVATRAQTITKPASQYGDPEAQARVHREFDPKANVRPIPKDQQ